MKRNLILLTVMAPLFGFTSTNSLTHAISVLNQLRTVSGDAVGETGAPGAFYLVSQELLAAGHMTNFVTMIASTNPIVRVMGAYCVIKTKSGKVPEALLDPLRRDRPVPYNPAGCVVGQSTVGDLVTELVRSPDVLEWRKKRARD